MLAIIAYGDGRQERRAIPKRSEFFVATAGFAHESVRSKDAKERLRREDRIRRQRSLYTSRFDESRRRWKSCGRSMKIEEENNQEPSRLRPTQIRVSKCAAAREHMP